MGSVNERLGKLEARMGLPPPPHEMSPIMSLLLKDMDRQRREMDGLWPDPADEVLTPEEAAADRQATRNFLPYLLGERERAHPDNRDHLDRWISEIEAEIAKLDEEDEA